MRIVIDMQGAQSASRFRGIGRYSMSLALAIVKGYHTKHEIFILLNGMFPESINTIQNAFHALLPKSHIKVWQGCEPTHYSNTQNHSRIEISSLLRDSFIASLAPDIVLILSTVEGYSDNSIITLPKNYPIPYAVIFYDAIPYMQADKYISPRGKRFEQYYYEKIDIIKEALIVFGISQSSAKEAEEVLDIDKRKIINISSAADKIFQPLTYTTDEIKNIQKHFEIKNKFLLYSGATDERKNHTRLIKAYSLLPTQIKECYQLIIAGGLPLENQINFKKTMSSCGLSDTHVLFLGKVSDKELIDLYNLCDLYIFPSYHEGFGLPVLEAMQCGAATIGANTTSVPEVIGREDALFNPFDEKDIASKIIEVLDSPSFKLSLEKHGLLHAKNFSWENSAEKVISGLENWFDTTIKNTHISLSSNKRIDKLISKLSTIKTQENDLYNISQAIAYNHNPEDKKQLLIDISELVQKDAKSGIQRVVRSILNGLLSSQSHNYIIRPVYATVEKQGYYYADTFMHHFLQREKSISIKDAPIDIHAGDIFLALDMSPSIQVYQHKYFEKLRKLGVDIHFIIYDILLINNPKWWPPGTKENFEKLLNTIVMTADDITCISASVASDVKKYINIKYPNLNIMPNINHFHLGADIDNSMPSKGFDKNHHDTLNNLENRLSFLIVGTIEPRKGHLQTLLAFEKLWEQGLDINLVIAGKEGWLVDEFINKLKSHPQLSKKLFWLNSISDEYLEKVYEKCICLLAPSEGEGFGLPLIEAAQKDLPIIARDIPVFREVAGEYAYYFNNDNSPKTLANTIKLWLNLYEKNQHINSDNMPWLTWKGSTQQLLGCIHAK